MKKMAEQRKVANAPCNQAMDEAMRHIEAAALVTAVAHAEYGQAEVAPEQPVAPLPEPEEPNQAPAQGLVWFSGRGCLERPRCVGDRCLTG